MPVLSNARHERMAQELANGKPASEAYVLAGYKPNRHNGATLARTQHIKARVAEILTEREQIHGEATARAVERAAVSKQWVIERLVENAERALQRQSVADQDGNTIEYRYEGNVANRALELLGKEMGMFIERKEVGQPGEFAQIENMTADELRAFVARTAQVAGLRQDASSDSGGTRPAGSKPH